MKSTAFLCSILLLAAMTTFGQVNNDFEQEKKKLQSEMNEYIRQTRKEFTDYVDGINKAYSEYLRKNWKEFSALGAMEPDSMPKPKILPEYNPAIDKIKPGEAVKVIPILVPDAIPQIILKIPNIPVILPEEVIEETSAPDDKKPQDPLEEATKPIIRDKQMSFYGLELSLEFDPAMKGSIHGEIHNTTIAGFWDRLNKSNYPRLIKRLSDLRTQMNLGDWGYYQLVKKTAEFINPDENYSRLLSWFLLTKSGYRIRVAYTDNQIALLFPSVNKIYGIRYFLISNVKYYAPGFTPSHIYTYEQDFPGATKALDLNIYNALNIGNDYVMKTISFRHNDKDYSIDVEYNANSIDFYKDFPLCELKLYFDAAITPRAKESLLRALQPLVEGMTEAESVNLLLSFVQKGFSYKTDPEQFDGREKFNFPEETLFYPYSDCDDRAIFFTWLVRELLELKVVGLVYPGHVATAVHLNGDEPGDFVMYKGEKYIVADPTYINAPMGLTMPGMKNSIAEVVEPTIFYNEKEILASIWEKVETTGGFRGDNFQAIDRDSSGNYYIAGYFKGELTIGGTTLTSNSTYNDAFIARFNKNGNPEWAISGGCEGNARAANIRVDDENNIFITGTFEKSIKFGGIMMFANSPSSAFVAKLNPDGKLLWMNQAVIDTADARDNIHVLSLTHSGKVIKSNKYPPDPNFTAYGISFDENKNVYYTATYAYTAGLIDKLTMSAESIYNVPAILKEETDKQIELKCNQSIAGLFSAISLLRNGTVAISGKSVQAAFEKYNPEFRKKSPGLYASIGKISMMKNDQGIITILTEDQKPIGLDRMKINHNTRLKLSMLPNGDARIDVLGGIKVGKAIIWYSLNYIKLSRNNGSMLFDYDSDHSQVTLDVRKDLL